jgi:hypothetical protein
MSIRDAAVVAALASQVARSRKGNRAVRAMSNEYP